MYCSAVKSDSAAAANTDVDTICIQAGDLDILCQQLLDVIIYKSQLWINR